VTDTTGPDEGAPIGAAATLPVAGKGRRRGAGGSPAGSKPTKQRGRRASTVFVVGGVAAVVLLALLPALGTAFVKTPRDRVGISYGGGPIEGSHFQKVVEPGSGLFFNGIFDQLYLYPADQQSFIISPGSESSSNTDYVRAPSSDRVQVSFQVALYFKLNTNRLREFHEELGLRFSAYTEKGWDTMIRQTFQPQVESAIQQETRRYTVAELFGDADKLESIQASVQTTISNRLERALGQRFFCGPDFAAGGECSEVAFVIKRIDLPDSVVAAFESNRTSGIAVQTKRNEIAQREAEAESIAALNEALAGSEGQYTLLKAIESGQINFWVLPNDGGVTLQTPDTANSADPGATPGG